MRWRTPDGPAAEPGIAGVPKRAHVPRLTRHSERQRLTYQQ
ncbi:MAG: hypothetical protein WB681_04165 [Candidatus Cybelea sp.]